MRVVSLESELDASLVNLAAMDADLEVVLNAQSHSKKTGLNPEYMYDDNYDSASCLQVPPLAELLSYASNHGPQIATSESHVTDSSILSAERSAVLRFILTSPAHFRRLQDDLRSARVVTTQSSLVALHRLLAERVRDMRAVREEALAKIRDEREREREHARIMGLLPFLDLDDEVCADNTINHGMGGGHNLGGKRKSLDWDHFLAGLTNVATNLGAKGGILKRSSLNHDAKIEQRPTRSTSLPASLIKSPFVAAATATSSTATSSSDSSSSDRTATTSNVCKTTYLHTVPETLPLSPSSGNSGHAKDMPPSRPKTSAGAHGRPRAARGA